MSALSLILLALGGLCVLFAGVYLLARRLDNYGIVDVAWSYAFGLLAVFFAATADGWLPRRLALAALVVAWSVRLGTHLGRRVAAHHPEEDGRYRRMRESWAGRFHATMFGFFQLQALSVVVLGLPFLVAMRHASPGFHPLEVAGALVWCVAILGESIADAQLAAFKREPRHRGAVCAAGLWRWSRHPNYFFEWLVWVGFALIALAAPAGWTGLIAPASILYLLLRVTGIPLTEEQAVRSKGDAYRRYQQSTSVFIPWPPRRAGVAPTS